MEQSKAHIYFMYAHDYNTGYVGKTNNVKESVLLTLFPRVK